MLAISARLVGLAAVFLATSVSAQTASITVDATKVGPRVNPQMYGIFLEEINHGVDGGLYAELVRNRAFEDARPPEGYLLRDGRWVDEQGFDSGYSKYGYDTEGVPFWSLITEGDARGSIDLQKSGGITEQSAYCLRLSVESVSDGRCGVANTGFFGIGVKQGERYRLSLYAKSKDAFGGPISVRLEDADGNACSDEAEVTGLGGEWQQFTAVITASETKANARLAITVGAPGTIWLDFVSLFPEKTWRNQANGLRPDIAQMIADLKPGFVRFPGGCVVEGGTVETAYDWKLTVGPLEERQERWGPWNYRRTQGTGLFEYLRFCQDMDAEPLWVGFCGQTCIFRQREHVPMSEMGWVRQNFLDIVEYANGPADSKWGRMRAEAGHPESFDLKLVEIGNENQGREYYERYEYIHTAMKEKYPDLKYLADLSWTSPASMREAAFDVEDRHYYNSSRWFLSRFREYDDRDRNRPPLYLGEVAVAFPEAGSFRGNLLAALAEGVFLMGCERNADVVQMVSYAPLLAHVKGRTELTGAPPPWHAMIYFDGTRIFGTASYYLWKLYGTNRPDQMIETRIEYDAAGPQAIAGQIGVGTWAASAEFKDIRVEKGGEVVYAADFAKGADDWKTDGGRWTVEDGAYRQRGRGNGLSYVGDASWNDYTLTLKARKFTGREGFLIVFGRQEADKYWWNLGGWGNGQHAIEHNQIVVGRPVRGTIESDRWYDIKIELSGRQIRCFLDGELVHDVTAPTQERFFVTAGRDEAGTELIVKAINTASDPQLATLKFQGLESVSPEATVTVLTSDSLSDNNSLARPRQVVPVETQITNAGAEFPYEFAPNSLTILRLKTPGGD